MWCMGVKNFLLFYEEGTCFVEYVKWKENGNHREWVAGCDDSSHDEEHHHGMAAIAAEEAAADDAETREKHGE